MTPNPWRGEVAILLDGKPYILRPTFAALSGIEQELGSGLVALAKRLAEGYMTLDELAVIITQCAVGAPPDMPAALVRGGLADTIASIGRMFAAVFEGCDDA